MPDILACRKNVVTAPAHFKGKCAFSNHNVQSLTEPRAFGDSSPPPVTVARGKLAGAALLIPSRTGAFAGVQP